MVELKIVIVYILLDLFMDMLWIVTVSVVVAPSVESCGVSIIGLARLVFMVT